MSDTEEEKRIKNVTADISRGVLTSSIANVQNATARNQHITDLIPTSLKSVNRHDGIEVLTTIIARVYEKTFYEYHRPSGTEIWRTARCEALARLADERKRKLRSDYIYSKISADVQLMKKKYPDHWDVDDEGINGSTFSSEASISDIQRMKHDKEQKFRKEIASRMNEYLPYIRNVLPIYNLRVVDGKRSAYIRIAIRNKTKDNHIFNEGNLVSITNASRSRNVSVHFSDEQHLKYNLLATKVSHPRRRFTPLTELATDKNFKPRFGEFDTVGIVYMLEFIVLKGKIVEVVHLAYPDPRTLSSAYLAIIFNPNRTHHGYKDIINVGTLISCADLKLYQGTLFNIPTACWSKETELSLAPRHYHLQVAMKDLNERMKEILYGRLSNRFHIGNYKNAGFFKKTGLKYLLS